MKAGFFCIAGTVALLSAIPTDNAQAIEECRRINNDLDRLACYDKSSGRTPEVEVYLSEQNPWRTSRKCLP
jgi:hypothetical protein